MEPRAFNIPEIQSLIAQHLDHQDLFPLSCVCKNFRDALAPLMWRHVRVGPRELAPAFFQSFQHNKHFIQTLQLDLHDRFQVEYLTLRGCDQLKTLMVGVESVWESNDRDKVEKAESQRQILSKVAEFVTAHASTLEEVSFELAEHFMVTPTRDFWAALAQCICLASLTLKHLAVQEDGLEDFLRTCATPRFLELKCMALPDYSTWPFGDERDLAESACDPSVDTTHIDHRHILLGPRSIIMSGFVDGPSFPGLCSYGQAMMIRGFPNLKDLHYSPGQCRKDAARTVGFHWDRDKNTAIFLRTLARNTWKLPLLESLEVPTGKTEDEELARILKQMHQLKQLNACGTGFDSLSFRALIESGGGRLCNTVERLDLQGCRGLTSFMVQTILARCPLLNSLKVTRITATDISQGHLWVCTSMVELQVCIEVNGDPSSIEGRAAQLAVYRQLARLTKLRDLELSRFWLNQRHTRRTILDLRLMAGLHLLASLKEMRKLSFSYCRRQEMGVQEARWIVENWPQMQHLTGLVIQNSRTLKDMRDILEEKDIVVQFDHNK